MPSKPSKSGLIAIKYCKKYSIEEAGDQTLARMILKDYPELMRKDRTFAENLHIIRMRVQHYRGHQGNRSRPSSAKYGLQTPLNYKYDRKNKFLENQSSAQYRQAQKRKIKKSKYYIITSAQNDSKLNYPFWHNVMAYSKHIGAEVHVVLNRYKNPTFNANSADETWNPEVIPYADANRQHIHKKLELLSDIKIQPTAINPLSGMEGISGNESCIFGHPKSQFRVIPALEGYEPKMMFTTGTVTLPNYSDSKAGKKGEFHHVYGFVIVEISDSETFFIRQVTALKSGSFCDLTFHVSDGTVSKIKDIDVAVLGDIHVGDHCPLVNKQQMALLDSLKPKNTIIHDIFNGHSINDHEKDDPIKAYEREVDGTNSLSKEISDMFVWIKSMLKYNLVFVASNHNDWLDRHIKSKDWKRSIKNAPMYIRCADILLKGMAPRGLIAYFIDNEFDRKVKTLGRDESFRVNRWELSQHLDVGVNGSRGSLGQFRKMSTKMIGGHSHTPSRTDGVLYVGTSTKLRVGYNIGASSWLNCDVIVHKNGKAQHIIYAGKNKEFTTFKLK